MIFSESSILVLRELIRPYLSEKRYLHILGVERAAVQIGDILMPDATSELRVAALLHDIAKNLSKDEQLELIDSYYTEISAENLATESALHSFAAPPLIKRDFPQYVSENILSAVMTHTLGRAGMSIFDEIIFLSDFIEDTREYPSCKQVAEFVFSHLTSKNPQADNEAIIHRASVMAIDHTIDSVTKRGQTVNSSALKTKQYLLSLLSENL